MLSKAISICLISMTSFFLSATAFAENEKPVPATKVASEVHTLTIGTLKLKAEEIDFKIQRDGKHVIKLEGQAGIDCAGIRVSADSIEAAYIKQKDLTMKLAGNVKIASEHDRLHAAALEVKFNFSSKLLLFKAGEGKKMTLARDDSSSLTEIQSGQIQIQYQDQAKVLLKALGSVSVTGNKANLNSRFRDQRTIPKSPSASFDAFEAPHSFFEAAPKPIKKQRNTSGAFFNPTTNK